MSTTIPKSAAHSNCTYHAFLSFRGDDVRYVFADLLYCELTKAGLDTFREEDDIEKGTEFEKKIEKAIHESRVAVIILSKDFASSTYCLDEVAMFMDRRKRGEVEVLPVFFDVDPDEVSEVKGTYGVSFEQHEEELKQNSQGEELLKKRGRMEEWRAALRQVSQVTGHVYIKGCYMSEFIKKVVTDAKRLADPIILGIPSHIIGKLHRFSVLERWVKDRSHAKRVALLHGAQGIGKKTIAAVLSNQNYKEFDAVVFLDRVAEKSKQPDGIEKLQSQLLSRLRMSKGRSEILSELEGIEGIKQGLKNRQVLIIIADVDQPQQFHNLVGDPGWVEEGSKVIVTSIYERLLGDTLCKKFPVSPFTPAQSLELFEFDAIKEGAPVHECQEMVLEALGYCCGNPSNIKALVSCLSSFRREGWNELLANLKMEIYQINGLKAKFASLPEDDKKLFYDIACFYADRDQDHVNSVLENCHLYNMKGGFERLRRSHWVKVDENRKVRMDLPIKDIGRDMVREKTEILEERSHIWSPEDAVKLLEKYSPNKDSFRNYYSRANHIRSFILDGNEGKASLASEMKFKTEALGRMTELKLLQLVNINLQGDCKYFPEELVWLSWEGMSVPEMPLNISLEYLVILELRNSKLQKLSNEKWSLKKLKILNLSHSRFLNHTPDYTCLPALEKLMLEDCILLEKIDSSIKDLRSLIQVSLKGCTSLVELPMLGTSAKILDISGCKGLCVMPNGSIESVVELAADHTEVDQLWIGPAGFSFSYVFPSLVKLSLVKCRLSIRRIISDLTKLSSLRDLDVGEDHFSPLSGALRPSISLRLRN